MVVSEVAENATGKGQSSYAVLDDAVAAYLHKGILTACLHHAAQQAVQLQRIGGGMGGRHLLVVNLVDDGGEEPRMAPVGTEQAVQQCDRGGLAVGPCDAHQLQLPRRVAVKVVGHHAQRQVAVFYHHISHALLQVFGHALAHYRHCTLFHGSVDIFMAVDMGTHLRHKAAVFSHLARVETDVANLGVCRHRIERCYSFYER